MAHPQISGVTANNGSESWQGATPLEGPGKNLDEVLGGKASRSSTFLATGED